ncbi:helix-turn-helix transcriptional regulator [Ralstonia sp.]|uniref:helix-turn-helix domain-containing protein n=1 Tax=unclassified Ralstonia TaxID=209769 RepID=UPI0031D72117
MDTIASRVLARRSQLNLSQDALAKRARLSQSTIAQIERGRNKSSRHIVKLADALLVPVRWLAEGGELPLAPLSSPGKGGRNIVPLEQKTVMTGVAQQPTDAYSAELVRLAFLTLAESLEECDAELSAEKMADALVMACQLLTANPTVNAKPVLISALRLAS